jgi:dolichol-phosphate mannosyltransferase
MSRRRQLVTVVIPCYNEARGIKKVIHDFHKSELTKEAFEFDILVVDNASTDDTYKIAQAAGARVIREPRKGKGRAMRTGFRNIRPDADFVVMIDGDDTYRPEEALRLLEPLHHGFCDVVVGSRLSGKIHGGSMSRLNRLGNWGFTHMVRLLYRANVTDVLSGYFAWKREVIEELTPHLHAPHFAIEMEMITKMSRMGCDIYSVPISLHQRKGEANLRPFGDGVPILLMFMRNLLWSPSAIKEGDVTKDEA